MNYYNILICPKSLHVKRHKIKAYIIQVSYTDAPCSAVFSHKTNLIVLSKLTNVHIILTSCVFGCLFSHNWPVYLYQRYIRPDITVMVDWALKNQLSIYLPTVHALTSSFHGLMTVPFPLSETSPRFKQRGRKLDHWTIYLYRCSML